MISRIGRELGRLISLRTKLRAFHPAGDQKILHIAKEVFAVLRKSPEGDSAILALVNVTDQACTLEVPLDELECEAPYWLDIVSRMDWAVDQGWLHLHLLPYDVVWLEPRQEASEDIDV